MTSSSTKVSGNYLLNQLQCLYKNLDEDTISEKNVIFKFLDQVTNIIIYLEAIDNNINQSSMFMIILLAMTKISNNYNIKLNIISFLK